MKKRLQHLLVALSLFAVANSAMAVLTTGTIAFTGGYGNGDGFVIFTSAVIAEPGCNTHTQFNVTGPGRKQILALATIAQQLGKSLTVNTNSCNGDYAKVDPAGGYAYIQ